MLLRRTALLAAAALLAACAADSSSVRSSVADGAAPPGLAQRQFERLKSLVGDWRATDEDGNAAGFSYRLTAGDSALVETLFSGTDHEMVTVYAVAGDELVLTHYCVLANQPRMVARDTGTVDRVAFECDGGLADEAAPHMHAGELRFESRDRVASDWTMSIDGAPAEVKRFTLTRR